MARKNISTSATIKPLHTHGVEKVWIGVDRLVEAARAVLANHLKVVVWVLGIGLPVVQGLEIGWDRFVVVAAAACQ
jgi:hypothetical protein